MQARLIPHSSDKTRVIKLVRQRFGICMEDRFCPFTRDLRSYKGPARASKCLQHVWRDTQGVAHTMGVGSPDFSLHANVLLTPSL
ncbi:TPA: hypothetical protein ACH3X3_002713 [Trebouxia sp. C0006]